MVDNYQFHITPNLGSPIVKINPAFFDIVGKVIKQSKLNDIHIINSVLYGVIKKNKNSFYVIRCRLSGVIGNNITMNFNIDDHISKLLGK